MSAVLGFAEMGIVPALRKIQIDWSLTLPELSALAHTPIETLNRYLGMSASELESQPSVPVGLENAVALLSVFSSLQKLRPESSQQEEWLKSPNSILENQVPLQVMMMSPDHLSWVSYTLSSAVQYS